MKRYKTTTSAIYDFPKNSIRTMASDIKTMREDFIDMCEAEIDFRKKHGYKSLVFALTYNNEHLTLRYGHNMLNANDLKIFAKSSRWYKALERSISLDFDYVCCGEYGEGGFTHGYKGVRGKGNNPHYHCIGWYKYYLVDKDILYKYLRSFGEAGEELIKLIEENKNYDFFPELVRLAWQYDINDDIESYATCHCPESIGFVKLSGEIFSSKGGSYVGKYIGKDINKLFDDSYNKGLQPAVIRNILDCLKAHKIPTCEHKDIVCAWHHAACNSVLTKYHVEHLRIRHEYKPTIGLYYGFVFEELDKIYVDTYKDFIKDLNTIYSPKLRKFHGFGYALAGECENTLGNLEDGTYTNSRKGYTRVLPKSLIRHFYYEHFVVENPFPSVVTGSTKCVKYVPNELGRKLIQNKLIKQNGKTLAIALQKFPKEYNKEYVLRAVNFYTFFKGWSIENTEFQFNSDTFFDVLLDTTKCLELHMSFVPTCVYERNIKEDRVFVNLERFLQLCEPSLASLVDSLANLLDVRRLHKNDKDFEFINAWKQVYTLKHL